MASKSDSCPTRAKAIASVCSRSGMVTPALTTHTPSVNPHIQSDYKTPQPSLSGMRARLSLDGCAIPSGTERARGSRMRILAPSRTQWPGRAPRTWAGHKTGSYSDRPKLLQPSPLSHSAAQLLLDASSIITA
jgi:hypothetical protein